MHECTSPSLPASQPVDPALARPYLTSPCSRCQDAQRRLRFLTHECTRLDPWTELQGTLWETGKTGPLAWSLAQLPAFLRAGSARAPETGRWRQLGLWVTGSQPGRAFPGLPLLLQSWSERSKEVSWCACPGRQECPLPTLTP